MMSIRFKLGLIQLILGESGFYIMAFIPCVLIPSIESHRPAPFGMV